MPRIIDYPNVTPVNSHMLLLYNPATGQVERSNVASVVGLAAAPDHNLCLGLTSLLLNISANTWTDVPWNTSIEKTGDFSGHGTTTAITIPSAGRYQMMFTAFVAVNSGTADVSVRLVKNGSAVNGLGFAKVNTSSGVFHCSGHPTILAASDEIKAQVLITGRDGVLGFSSSPQQQFISVRRVG